jgi:mono/diheme cytochrome c family protein
MSVRAGTLLLAATCGFLPAVAMLADTDPGESRREPANANDGLGGKIGLGRALFERTCSVCHGIDGKGGRGPNLNRLRLARAPDDSAQRGVIRNGVAHGG